MFSRHILMNQAEFSVYVLAAERPGRRADFRGARFMQRFFAIFLMIAGLSWPQFANAGPNEDAVAARAQWEQVYNSGDADKFVALYTKDATLFGSTAQLFSGSDGVRAYFGKLPPGIKAKMGDQQAIAIGPDVVLSSGFADFTLKDGTVIPYRLTLALVKTDGRWLIAQHHGSPLPK
jgi:uncharacterized protein (TIGR02246 family)